MLRVRLLLLHLLSDAPDKLHAMGLLQQTTRIEETKTVQVEEETTYRYFYIFY